jgi:hypothetical protein
VSTDANGDGMYKLIQFKVPDAKIIMHYESGYFMRDLDPAASFQEAQNIIQPKFRF